MRDWIYGSDAEGPMQLAIFLDATAVAGDTALLRAAREHLDTLLADSDSFVARFAAAADRFDEPASWWTRLTARRDEQLLDLKKLGTFPIVHGVRALALRRRVHAVGTAERIAALVAQGELDVALARDLNDALHLLMSLRLAQQLRQRAAGVAPDNLLQPSSLGTIERDALRDALAIVRRFRALLRQRLRLDSL
jgi:CBS domain-containing protein